MAPNHLSNGKQPVWDLPVRLVHWTLAGLIAFSWWSVNNHHTDWHIWSGCAILTLLIFRFLWGFVGSSTARFSSFVRGPGAVRDYLRGRWSGIGHTPLGALSVLALFGAIAVQVSLVWRQLVEAPVDRPQEGRLADSTAADQRGQIAELDRFVPDAAVPLDVRGGESHPQLRRGMARRPDGLGGRCRNWGLRS